MINENDFDIVNDYDFDSECEADSPMLIEFAYELEKASEYIKSHRNGYMLNMPRIENIKKYAKQIFDIVKVRDAECKISCKRSPIIDDCITILIITDDFTIVGYNKKIFENILKDALMMSCYYEEGDKFRVEIRFDNCFVNI